MRDINVDRVDCLLWIEEIKQLKARYFRFVDTQDWEGFRSLFAPDAKLTLPASSPTPLDLDSAISKISSGLAGVTTVHHGHTPEIEILSASTASGIWAMGDVLLFSADGESARKRQSLHGYGHYTETYRRIEQRWVIQTLRLSRLLTVEHRGDLTGQWTRSPY